MLIMLIVLIMRCRGEASPGTGKSVASVAGVDASSVLLFLLIVIILLHHYPLFLLVFVIIFFARLYCLSACSSSSLCSFPFPVTVSCLRRQGFRQKKKVAVEVFASVGIGVGAGGGLLNDR